MLLLNGEVAGIWRRRKDRTMLQMCVNLMNDVTVNIKDVILHEADTLGPLRRCVATEILLQ